MSDPNTVPGTPYRYTRYTVPARTSVLEVQGTPVHRTDAFSDRCLTCVRPTQHRLCIGCWQLAFGGALPEPNKTAALESITQRYGWSRSEL